MARPSKTTAQIRAEGRSHRTRAELEQREKQENALLTGETMSEEPATAADPNAHQLFVDCRRLLRKIGKNDALYGTAINRYCQLYAECLDFQQKREVYHRRALDLETQYADEKKGLSFYQTLADLESKVIGLDRQVQAKRKMLLDIEKESCMTIAAALRAIPKQVPDETENDDMNRFLSGPRGIVNSA